MFPKTKKAGELKRGDRLVLVTQKAIGRMEVPAPARDVLECTVHTVVSVSGIREMMVVTDKIPARAPLVLIRDSDVLVFAEQDSGYTLMEVLIGLVFLGVLAMFVFGAVSRVASQDEAEKEARTFAAQYVPGAKIACVAHDTDGDGYVSCTVFSPSSEVPPLAIECAGAWTLNKGCRVATPRIRR